MLPWCKTASGDFLCLFVREYSSMLSVAIEPKNPLGIAIGKIEVTFEKDNFVCTFELNGDKVVSVNFWKPANWFSQICLIITVWCTIWKNCIVGTTPGFTRGEIEQSWKCLHCSICHTKICFEFTNLDKFQGENGALLRKAIFKFYLLGIPLELTEKISSSVLLS